jgi:hypothetical protein
MRHEARVEAIMMKKGEEWSRNETRDEAKGEARGQEVRQGARYANLGNFSKMQTRARPLPTTFLFARDPGLAHFWHSYDYATPLNTLRNFKHTLALPIQGRSRAANSILGTRSYAALIACTSTRPPSDRFFHSRPPYVGTLYSCPQPLTSPS